MTSTTQESDIDRMRNLPHHLLLDILGLSLSSMKTRVAVQASILLKAWNHLWPSFTSLDFDLNEFNSGDPEQDQQRFSRFVTAMLERHKAAKVDKFRLSCENICDEQYIPTILACIAYVLHHEVKVLELSLCSRMGSLMTRGIATYSESLEELYLHLNDCGCLGFKVDSPIESTYLPRLQKLHLHSQGMMCGYFLRDLISHCPMLKDLWLESFMVPYSSIIRSECLELLTLKNCILTHKIDTWVDSVEFAILKIKFPSLRKLRFHGEDLSFDSYFPELLSGCPLLEDLWLESFSVPFGSTICSQKLQNLTLKNCKNTDRLINIVAPSLVSFCFVGLIEDAAPVVHTVGSIPSLIHANFSLRDNSDNYFLEYALIRSLSNVENLELCVNKLSASPQSPPYYLTFYNLRSLSFCGHCSNYVIYMCKDMPNLEKITFWPYCQHSLWFYEVLVLFR